MALDFSRFGTPVEQAPVLDFSKFGTPVEAEKEEPPSRTFGEAAVDVSASLVKGLGQVAQFPGQLVGLVPGMRGMGEALAAPGAALAEYGEGLKSAGLKAREALRNKALSEAEKEGFLAEFATAIKSTVTDPALLSSFLLEQVPQLLGPAAAVKVTMMLGRKGVQAVAEGEARKAAETSLRKRAAAAAVGTGAAAQGSSIGDETYKAVYDLAIKQGKTEEEARALAAEKARVAALEAGVISVATSRLPGGSAIERRLAGLPGVPGAGRIGVGVREGVTGGLEEAGGAFAKGVGMAEVEPTISPVTGVGTAAGLGVIGDAGLGAIVGGQPTPETAPRPGAPEAEPLIERKAREAAEAAKAPAEPTPPVVETPAPPPIEEPKVRKSGEPPAGGMQPADIDALGLSNKQPIYRRMLGKDLENPEQRAAVLADIENYLTKGYGSEESRAKLTEFKAKFAESAAPAAPVVTPTPTPPAPPPEAAAPAPEAAPPVETLAPPPPAEAVGRTPASFAADIAAGKKLDSPEDVQFYQNNAAEIEAELKKIVVKPSTSSSTTETSTKLLTRSSFKDPRDFWEYLKGLPIGALNGSEIEASGWMGEDLSGTVESEDSERLTVRKYDGTKALVDRVSINDVIPKAPTTPPAPPPAVEAAAPAPAVEAAAPPPAPEPPSVEPTEPEAGGAGAPVAGGPTAVTPTEGAGAVEPVRVVPPVADAEQPAGGEAAQPVAVTPPAAEPEYTEEDIDRAVDLGVLSEEEADAYRAELRGEEAPATAMAAAFEERVAALKAEQDALRQKNGKPPALKSKNRAKFDELQAQIDALSPVETGTLKEKLEKAQATGVFTVKDGKPILDIPAVRSALKGRDPKMLKAVLTYIGVDEDGNYLPTTYSADEAAQSVGMAKSSGANVRRIAETLGITTDVISRFQAAQTGIIGIAKNVSEASLSGLPVENPKAGLLYETGKKGTKAVGFLRPALTETGGLDFTKLDTRQLADIYSRASRYDAKDNAAVMQQLNAEVEARRKADRKGTDAAINRAYGKLVEEEEAVIEREDTELEAEPETVEAEDTTRRLSDEDIEDAQQTRTGPVDLQNSREMEAALRGKSFMESIDYAIKNARDDLDKQILVKAKRRAEELANKGVVFTFSLTAPGRILTGGRLGLTTTVPAGLGDAVAVDVKLNGFTNDPSDTLSQETLVHEIVHAVTTAQIEYAPQGTAAIKLRVLQQELVGVYNSRFRAGTLTATEKGVVSNALEKPSELLAYGLTNGEVQNWLASIPSPTGGTFLSRMFDIVSQVLGLKGKENSALARLMSVSEEILDESLAPYVTEANRRGMSLGKQANTTGFPGWVWKESQGLKPVWNQGPVALYEGASTSGKTIYVAAKQNVGSTNVDIRSYTGGGFTPAELTELRKAADGFTPQATPRIAPETEKAVEGVDVIGEQAPALTPKGNPALRMRIKFADSLAGLEDVFTAAYSGQVRTATGRLNPMVMLSRALDTQRVSRAVQKEGALVTKEGLLMADKLVVDGREISYKDTLARIAETAKKEGKTYEQYRETIDKVLYGHREYNLREYNRNLDQQADALEAAGKTKDAKAMRADKVTLALNDKQIDALEDAFQKDAFIQGVSKDLDAIRFSLLDKLVEVGRISEEKAKEWKENTGYIPFHRIEQYSKEYDEAGRGTNRGVVAMKKIRSLEGSERATTSPVENFSQFMDWAVGEAMKNEAGTRALTDLELLGSAKRQAEPPAFDSPGGMVTVYEKGVPVKFYVQDPGLYVGLSLQEKELGSIAKAFQRLGTQPLRAGVTALPPFAIKQVFDDIVRAYAYAGVKNNAAVVKNILLNFPKNWYKEIFKVKDKGIQELENLGVVGTFDFTKQGNLKNILEEAGAKKEGLGSAIFRVMEAGAKASDLAVRQAIYQQVLKETGDIAQAESAAREIINFSRRGAAGAMQTAISVIPFFNAYAQGMDKLATAAAGRVVGTKLGVARSMFYKRMAVLTGMGLAYALLMSDDEEYQALPDHVRDTNWILPYGKYLGYTPAIPVPAELAFFFKAIPERVVQFYKHQGTDEERAALDVVKELLVRGVDVFSSPNLTPQLIRPFLENIANYSFFLGRPLESQAQLRQRPFMRSGIGTSDSMKVVAELLEDAANATGIEAIAISPIKLENLIRGLLGTAGGTALALSDAAFFPSRTDRPLHQQLKSQLTGASAVMKDAVGTRYLDKVYKLESDVEQVYNTYNRLLQDKPEKTAEFIEDNKGLYSIRPAVQGLMTAIRSLNAAARQIDKTTDISTDERRRRVDELRIEQNDLARQALMLRKLAMNIQLGK